MVSTFLLEVVLFWVTGFLVHHLVETKFKRFSAFEKMLNNIKIIKGIGDYGAQF